jgi:hypothetical protein
VMSARANLAHAEFSLALMKIERTAAGALKEKLPDNAAKEKALVDALPALRQAVTTAESAPQKSDYAPVGTIYPRTSTGRRQALAGWIANRANPLTARVIVNHVWMRHFHEPLVGTVYDFGRNGAAPTHPELLDWLAVELMESNWSLKHLHRLIATSSAYQLHSGSGRHAAAAGRDPQNRTLWHFPLGQLEAEIVRDALLALGGGLDHTTGGVPLPNSDWEKSRRRSLYFECHPEAGGHSEFAAVFDPPNACDAYRRTQTVLPQQALALTNSHVTLREAAALAKKIDAPCPADADFARAAIESILCREPTASELAICAEFLKDQPRPALIHALFNHNDFLAVR